MLKAILTINIMKKNKNLIISIIILVIGFFVGFITKSMFVKETVVENSDISSENTFVATIKESDENNEKIDEFITEYENLENRLQEINREKQEITAEMLVIKNKINKSTDFKFEKEIFSEEKK